MATIAEIRQKFPQYNDMPDEVLAEKMYTKFYADMPRDQFDAKIGLSRQPQFGDPGVGDPDVPGYAPLPGETPEPKPQLSTWERARPYIEPSLEVAMGMTGAVGGGVLGGLGGGIGALPGSVAGAGLGVAGARELMEMGDVYLGGKAPRQGMEQVTVPMQNVIEGAGYELGGRLAASAIGKVAGKAIDVFDIPRQKAARIAREAAGKDLPWRQAALAESPEGLTGAQATAQVVNPRFQALAEMAAKREPEVTEAIKNVQADDIVNNLARRAKGATATEVRTAVRDAKNKLNRRLIPIKENELAKADQTGVKPEPVFSVLKEISDNPEFAGNRELRGAMREIRNELKRRVDPTTGNVPAEALDGIRKNVVNAVQSKMTSGTPSQQKALTSRIMSEIRPAIVGSIEEAGGTNYGRYLNVHSEALRKVDEQRLTGKALELFNKNQDEFVRLATGESPQTVEKIMGKGSYDVARDISEKTLAPLRESAQAVLRDKEIAAQATEGQEALRQLLQKELPKWRIPSYLSAITTTTNEALKLLEDKIGRKTMDHLAKSLRTVKGTQELLNTLPASERIRVLDLLSHPDKWGLSTKGLGVGTAVPARETINNLAGERQNKNALSR